MDIDPLKEENRFIVSGFYRTMIPATRKQIEDRPPRIYFNCGGYYVLQQLAEKDELNRAGVYKILTNKKIPRASRAAGSGTQDRVQQLIESLWKYNMLLFKEKRHGESLIKTSLTEMIYDKLSKILEMIPAERGLIHYHQFISLLNLEDRKFCDKALTDKPFEKNQFTYFIDEPKLENLIDKYKRLKMIEKDGSQYCSTKKGKEYLGLLNRLETEIVMLKKSNKIDFQYRALRSI